MRTIAAIILALSAFGCASRNDSLTEVQDGHKVKCLTACKEWERSCTGGGGSTTAGGTLRCSRVCKRFGKECYDVE